MNTVTVNAAFVKVTPQGKEILITDEVLVTVKYDLIKPSELMDELYEGMKKVATNLEINSNDWMLQMLYKGRCWYLQPNKDGTGIYDLGYFEVITFHAWNKLLG